MAKELFKHLVKFPNDWTKTELKQRALQMKDELHILDEKEYLEVLEIIETSDLSE